ncbi:MAG: hypothetical protein H6551_06430 [Chitinophagales bacterium]|nr:hypothetical protein [Chitinophagaceae bacterium]MCB9064765.1 hypothetical protein [Chitinophagales bacterium]
MKKKFIITIFTLFVILSLVFYWMKTAMPGYNFTVLMSGNVIMALLSTITYIIVIQQMKKAPEAFVRGVYASSFLKLFVCIVSITVYAIVNKPNVHKPSLFVLFGIYAAYSITETWMLSKMARAEK